VSKNDTRVHGQWKWGSKMTSVSTVRVRWTRVVYAELNFDADKYSDLPTYLSTVTVGPTLYT